MNISAFPTDTALGIWLVKSSWLVALDWLMPISPMVPIAIKSALKNVMASASRPFIVENMECWNRTANCTAAAAVRLLGGTGDNARTTV
ncbi:hypothetical protein AWB65_06082 [Caballeronia humi]|uniref:Uncharacterized protein n=2 Tax=Caballeronia humi TaxID=326474 RepID=A0A158J796_9BURK|nr:hypothetical protein AWB65_06082 [Caballeronia humi]